MGAPRVIPAPTKSYVVINSMGSDKSIPATLCDLGRVSSMATAVTLSRTSNIAPRNNRTQNRRSIHQRKRPISEVLDNSNQKEMTDNTARSLSIMNQPNISLPNVNGSESHANQSSLSVMTTPFSQAKRIKVESTSSSKSSPVPSPDASRRIENNQKKISVSAVEKAPMNLSTQYQTSESTFLDPKISIQRTVQVSHGRSEVDIHSNEPVTTQTNQLTYQQPMSLPAPGMGMFPSQATTSKAMQLQQQNQQLRSDNMILQKQLSLFRQLINNPKRLKQVLTRLEQRAH